jgi:hypothetical protein
MINTGSGRGHGGQSNLLLEYARNIAQMVDEEVVPFEVAEAGSTDALNKKFLDHINKEIPGASTWERSSLVMDLTKWMRTGATDLATHASAIAHRPEVMKEILPSPSSAVATLTSMGYTRTDLPSRTTDPDAYGGFIGAILTLNAVANGINVNTKAIRMLNKEADTVLRYTSSFVGKMRQIEANLIKSMEQFTLDAPLAYTGTAPHRGPSSRAPGGSRPRGSRATRGADAPTPRPPSPHQDDSEPVPMLGGRARDL